MIIYKITNNINGKIYIGQTINTLEWRIAGHKRTKNSLVGRAFIKHGFENFIAELIDKAETIEELNIKEYEWVKFYNCIVPLGYNQCEGGGNTLGYHHKEESKLSMSIKKKKMYLGEQNPFYGKTHSDEKKAEWSQQRKGRLLSEEWKRKIGEGGRKKVINLDTGEVFISIKAAAEKYNLKDTHITRVCKGKRKTTGGFRWQYSE